MRYSNDPESFERGTFAGTGGHISAREKNFRDIILKLEERPDTDTRHDAAEAVPIGWDEYGAALNEAMTAREEGDGLRHALMIGFASGLLFRDPGPWYPEGTFLDAITQGYEKDRPERLQWAKERLLAYGRFSDHSGFMRGAQYDRHMKE